MANRAKKTLTHGESDKRQAPAKREFIWDRLERRSRPNSTNLTLDRILRLAMDLADREGIEALSMRRIAAELQSGVMSLYYYVPKKADLLDLLLDEALGEARLPETSSGDWRADLRVLASELRRCLKRHVWAQVLLNSRPALGPKGLAQMDFVIGALTCLRLSREAAWRAMISLYVYVLGSVTLELSEARALRRADLNRGAAPYVQALFATGRYPNVARYFSSDFQGPGDEEAFEAGLDLVLQGIAALART